MTRISRSAISGMLGFAAILATGPAAAQATVANDYPTIARADYVFACMAANGQTRPVLEKCACSIDVVASILPYSEYVEAETVMAMALGGGERMAMFRTEPGMRTLVSDLRRAQAEAEIRCF